MRVTANPDAIKIDGEHIKSKDVSYNIWQKKKGEHIEDFEKAVALSEWTKRQIDTDEEFMGLTQCTDTKV